ncbi:hypothetical protein [Fundidesulfovibrio butyratiphilus]
MRFLDGINLIPIERNLVVHHSVRQQCWVLNPLAARIFSGLHAGLSRESIVQAVSFSHGISKWKADKLFGEALSSWIASGLLVDETLPSNARAAHEQSADAPQPVRLPQQKRYTICGLHFSLGFPDGELRNALEQLFACYLDECESSVDSSICIVRNRERYALYEDGHVVDSSHDASGISSCFFKRLVGTIAGGRDVRACFHAAVLLRGEAAFLVSGKSLSGKSTFATALSCSGFEMLNDEFAFVCGERHQVKTLPLPVKLRRQSWDLLDAYSREVRHAPICMRCGEPVKFVSSAKVSLGRLRQGFCLRGMCFLHRSQAASPQCVRISATETFVRLIEGRSWVDPDGNKLGSLLKWLETVPSFALCYADLRQAVAMMKECVCRDFP